MSTYKMKEARTRREFLKVASSLPLAGAPGYPDAARAEPAAAGRPNVILIVADQLRGQDLGCMENADVQTPHIDRLASEGVLLPNTFANTPLCTPARGNLLTGKFAHAHAVPINDLRMVELEVTLGHHFSRAGYRTGFIGKWHLDGGKRLPGFIPPGLRRHGFQFWAANECDHTPFRSQYFHDTSEPIPITEFEAITWTDIAIGFLRDAGGKPFFLEVAMGPPHPPYAAPPEYVNRYDAAKLHMRANWVEVIKGGSRTDIATYYAMISAIDDQVGRLMQALKDLSLEENTIVLVTSDHGNMLASHGLTDKQQPFEESIAVPGVLRFPQRIRPGRRLDVFFTHVDMGPTLLALCGLPVPREMQGADVSGALTGQERAAHHSAYFQVFAPYHIPTVPFAWRGVRNDRYMYARSKRQPWVLYDLQRDPYELKNLADDPAARGIREQMEKELGEWMERSEDSWDYTWDTPWNDRVLDYDRTFYTFDEYLEWAAEHKELLHLK
ncbi:MAG: sulfatase [Terriglobia bacterium]